jgi:hypothetical protein
VVILVLIKAISNKQGARMLYRVYFYVKYVDGTIGEEEGWLVRADDIQSIFVAARLLLPKYARDVWGYQVPEVEATGVTTTARSMSAWWDEPSILLSQCGITVEVVEEPTRILDLAELIVELSKVA